MVTMVTMVTSVPARAGACVRGNRFLHKFYGHEASENVIMVPTLMPAVTPEQQRNISEVAPVVVVAGGALGAPRPGALPEARFQKVDTALEGGMSLNVKLRWALGEARRRKYLLGHGVAGRQQQQQQHRRLLHATGANDLASPGAAAGERAKVSKGKTSQVVHPPVHPPALASTMWHTLQGVVLHSPQSSNVSIFERYWNAYGGQIKEELEEIPGSSELGAESGPAHPTDMLWIQTPGRHDTVAGTVTTAGVTGRDVFPPRGGTQVAHTATLFAGALGKGQVDGARGGSHRQRWMVLTSEILVNLAIIVSVIESVKVWRKRPRLRSNVKRGFRRCRRAFSANQADDLEL